MTRDLAAWRLGLVIPKRFVRSAVARNAVKRRWREAFRQRRVGLAEEFGAADLVVRLQASLQPKVVPAVPVAPESTFDAAALLDAFAARLRVRGMTASRPR